MGHLNLTSSYKELVWSGVNPVRITSIIPQIKEIDVNYAVIELDYVTTAENTDGESDYYSIKEYYRVSYKEPETEDDTETATGAEDAEASEDTGEAITQAQYPL